MAERTKRDARRIGEFDGRKGPASELDDGREDLVVELKDRRMGEEEKTSNVFVVTK